MKKSVQTYQWSEIYKMIKRLEQSLEIFLPLDDQRGVCITVGTVLLLSNHVKKIAGSVVLNNPDIYIGIVKVSSKDGDDTVLMNLYENGLENPFNLRMKAQKNVPNHLIIREINLSNLNADNPMPNENVQENNTNVSEHFEEVSEVQDAFMSKP